MGSEDSWNKMNDGTSFQPSEPALCANGCGFFGSAATMNMCSKCFRDVRVKEEQAAAAKAAMDKLVHHHDQTTTVLNGFSGEVGVGPSSSSESSAALVTPTVGVDETEPAKVPANRCWSCKKKVGVMGFTCRCGSTFCGTHRYPEKHECTYDFKGVGRDAIAQANPVVKADKVQRI